MDRKLHNCCSGEKTHHFLLILSWNSHGPWEGRRSMGHGWLSLVSLIWNILCSKKEKYMKFHPKKMIQMLIIKLGTFFLKWEKIAVQCKLDCALFHVASGPTQKLFWLLTQESIGQFLLLMTLKLRLIVFKCWSLITINYSSLLCSCFPYNYLIAFQWAMNCGYGIAATLSVSFSNSSGIRYV